MRMRGCANLLIYYLLVQNSIFGLLRKTGDPYSTRLRISLNEKAITLHNTSS